MRMREFIQHMTWEAVVEYFENNTKIRQLIRVEADSFQQAREKIIAQYGVNSINIGPRQVME